MKKLLSLIAIAAVLVSAIPASARNPLAPDAVLQGTRNELAPNSATTIDGLLQTGTQGLVDLRFGQVLLPTTPFMATATISGTSASVPLTLVSSSVMAPSYAWLLSGSTAYTNQSVYVESFRIIVSGTAPWVSGTNPYSSNLTIQSTGTSPSVFATVSGTALTASAALLPSSAGVTLGTPYLQSTGGGANQGLVVVGGTNNATGGSPAVVTVFGFIK